MATTKVVLEVQAVLVRENDTCVLLKPGDKDSDASSALLPDGGYKALSEILYGSLPDRELLVATIDALVDAAYQIGRREERHDRRYLKETEYKQLQFELNETEDD